MNDLYQFKNDNDTHLYEIVGEAQFTEFRDGNPFTYPITMFKSADGKDRSCPSYCMDMLTVRIPFKVTEVDSFEKFIEYFELATEGKFTKEINSYSSTEYFEYKQTAKALVENYNSSFQQKNLSNESKSLLEGFIMLLMVQIEMSAAKKAGKLRPQPKHKDDIED
jgi:hypothetical protein